MALTWKQTLPAWWSFFWRSVIYGAAGGFLFGAVGGAIAGATRHLNRAHVFGAILGYLAGVSLSTLAFKQALQVHLEDLTRVQTTRDS